MSQGIVVDHKESGVRYAISQANFNPKVHTKVRDLKPGETVRGFAPRRREPLGSQGDTTSAPRAIEEPQDDSNDSQQDPSGDHKTTTSHPKPEGFTKDSKDSK